MTTEFGPFERDDRINTARWLSGIAFEASTDRLKAFVEVLDLLEAAAGTRDRTELRSMEAGTVRTAEEPAWVTATPVVDADGDVWDRRDDGLYESRTGVVMSAAHVDADYGPVKPVAEAAS